MTQPPLPNWVYDLVNAITQYEHDHGRVEDGWPCLGNALDDVPREVREGAAAIHRYRLGRGEITQPVADALTNREHA